MNAAAVFSVRNNDVSTSRSKLLAATAIKAARTYTLGHTYSEKIMQHQNNASLKEQAKSPHGLQRKWQQDDYFSRKSDSQTGKDDASTIAHCLSTFSSSNFSAHQGQLLVVWTASLN